MQANHILTADLLDILFEGRNKEYGAYELRRSYNTRIRIALSVMLSIVALFIIGSVFGGKGDKSQSLLTISDSVMLSQVEIPNDPPPPPPPPPVKPPDPPKIQTTKFMTVVVKPDINVNEDDKPPVNEDLEDVRIGSENVKGDKDDGRIAPPQADAVGKGIIEEPKKPVADAAFIPIEKEATYPGGAPAWTRFLKKNLAYPQEAVDNEIEGTVIVEFIVDENGQVSNVKAISGPPELHDAAIRVIKKSGKWEPALQNGHLVRSPKRQPVGFILNKDSY